METSSSIFPKTALASFANLARLVIGPRAITEHPPLPISLFINSTASTGCSYPGTSGKKLSPNASTPWVSRALTYSRFKGTAAPLYMGISSRPIRFKTFFALENPMSTGPFPLTTVMPATCSSSIESASIKARLSSIPGSQSIITLRFSIPASFLSSSTSLH